MRGPAIRIMRSSGNAPLRLREGGGGALQEVEPGRRAAGRDEADLLAGRVAELGAQRVAVGDLGRVEAGDVAGEAEVLLGPVADRGQAGAERLGHEVVGVADEDRAVAQRAGGGRRARPSAALVSAARNASRSPPPGIGSTPTKSVSQT